MKFNLNVGVSTWDICLSLVNHDFCFQYDHTGGGRFYIYPPTTSCRHYEHNLSSFLIFLSLGVASCCVFI
jgi:hypothetical protein